MDPEVVLVVTEYERGTPSTSGISIPYCVSVKFYATKAAPDVLVIVYLMVEPVTIVMTHVCGSW